MKTNKYDAFVCAWCGRIKDTELGWIQPVNEDCQNSIKPPSHGLCDDCYREVIGDFLDALPIGRFVRQK